MSDLISRAELFNRLAPVQTLADAYTIIQGMPTIEPEQKKGKWVCSDDMYETAVCSCCGWDTTDPWDHIRHWFKYCPHCGAKMEGYDE